MAGFAREVIDGVASEREVELTTFGRNSGNSSRRILWAYTDGERVFIRSGGGLGRDWPRNFLANGRGILHVAGQDVPVTARHVTDVSEARQTGRLARAKYGNSIQITTEGDEPTLGEQATFELLPA
ncbi:MAG TPA: nitroreductase/quinone reductase family protein [Thermomicrobiales bacterium]|nr:nitroreductase/quinone reductase family protein [Thermomicrobiales bacterium]